MRGKDVHLLVQDKYVCAGDAEDIKWKAEEGTAQISRGWRRLLIVHDSDASARAHSQYARRCSLGAR